MTCHFVALTTRNLCFDQRNFRREIEIVVCCIIDLVAINAFRKWRISNITWFQDKS